MPVQWYYQNQAGDVGPVSVAELKYLINVGTIGDSTLVRSGDKDHWLAAVEIKGLLAAAGGTENPDESGSEIPEWHFNLKGRNKQGPVRGASSRQMIAGGRASVRRPGLEAGDGVVGRRLRCGGFWPNRHLPRTMHASRQTGFALPMRRRIFWAGVTASGADRGRCRLELGPDRVERPRGQRARPSRSRPSIPPAKAQG